MNERDIFVRQTISRSAENRAAFHILYSAKLYGVCISILRQELDSMVRVIYLLSKPLDRRQSLIAAAVRGDKWLQQNSGGRIMDWEMVELSQNLHGWTKSVYKFGCSFIHLSAMHDYNDRDPFSIISESDRDAILEHCRNYHGGPSSDYPKMADFIPFLPSIVDKVSGNLICYLNALQGDEVRRPWFL